ncbi:MAG: hypothetical protein ABII09_10515 [Planctomycetota bacterium]
MASENKTSEILESLMFARIFRSFRMAIQPSKLIIAFGMIAAIGLAGWIMDLPGTVVETPNTKGAETELNLYMTAPERVESYIERYANAGERTGVFATLWCFGRDKFHGVLRNLFAMNLPGAMDSIAEYLRAVKWAVRYHPVYCVIFGVIKLCIVSIGGGAICRIAALQFARDEKPGVTETLRYSLKKFWSFFTTPLVPAGIAIVAGAFIFLLGVLGNIPLGLGELIVGLFVWVGLLAGAIVAAVVIGTAAGFNLMFPAIAYDGSDSLDAVSRSFNYVYAKPWRMGFYTITAFVYGAICYIFVRFFAYLLLWATYTGLRIGAGLNSAKGLSDKIMAIWQEPSFGQLLVYSTDTGSISERGAALLVYLSVLIIVGLVVSFIISFYFSSNTVIYALMRNKVDGTALEEVYTEPEQTRAKSNGPEDQVSQSCENNDDIVA